MVGTVGNQGHWEVVKEKLQEVDMGRDRRPLAAASKGKEGITVWRLSSQSCTCFDTCAHPLRGAP